MEAEEDTAKKESEVKFGLKLKKTEDVRASGVRRVHSEDHAEGINREETLLLLHSG